MPSGSLALRICINIASLVEMKPTVMGIKVMLTRQTLESAADFIATLFHSEVSAVKKSVETMTENWSGLQC